ncbi:MAG: type II toxin-antitoxin system ParD family antitoxin [Gammaproteobacteria bacterium]|nr:type II toxin-antitoxin system ParD family antitoxin [Gammaproteobacteria bacterium]MYB40428.1 type II toxin-antitoxin system ParD family antitoxin [Candidatus Saccharibacteria bacterium]
MATFHISLPGAMKDWVEGQTKTGRYDNASEYVRDLICHDQVRAGKIEAMQKRVDEAFASGIGRQSLDDIWKAASRPAGRGD